MDFSNLNVLVIGDICLDIVEDGSSTRLSPEAPVPVILNPVESYSLGMAANVVSNVYNLGANIDFVFLYGSDYYGSILSKMLSEKFNARIIEEKDNSKTIVKKRIFANGQQVARIDHEHYIDEMHVINNLTNFLQVKISEGMHYDAVIISDYNKGIITEFTWMHIRPLLEELSENFFVDTKKLDVLNYFNRMIITPNSKEMGKLLEFNFCINEDELREKLNTPFIIETASEKGAYIYEKNNAIHCGAYKEDVIDICGCGDTFISAFALFYTKFKNKIKALDFANYCASKVSQKKGTSSVYLSEVIDFSRKWEK